MWTIFPRLGAGLLRFGATPVQVATVLGHARSTRTDFLGDLEERRGDDVPVLTYSGGELVEICLHPGIAAVSIAGIDVFCDDPRRVLARLHALDGGAMAGVGAVLFPGLCLNTTGFVDLKDPERRPELGERSLTVFVPGRCDFVLPEMSAWQPPAT